MGEEGRKRPLGYCPTCDRFIFYDELVSGEAKIVPVDSLSKADQKKLVIERYRVVPKDTKLGPISGLRQPDDVIREIEQDEPFGQMTLEAELNSVRNTLEEIARYLQEKTGTTP
jgi:hypothetical protein